MRVRLALLVVFAFFAPGLATSACAGAAPMRAMWVYGTAELLHSDKARAEIIAFCRPRKITDLFLQAHFVAKAKDRPCEIAEAGAMHGFLREAKARGIQVHALAGDPVHALRENHERALARVEALAVFNENAAPEERFAGLHLDIEPHGLPQWKQASDAELSKVDAAYAGHRGYAGLAYFMYAAFKTMPRD